MFGGLQKVKPTNGVDPLDSSSLTAHARKLTAEARDVSSLPNSEQVSGEASAKSRPAYSMRPNVPKDIVQFSAPVFFAEEADAVVNIEVMRMGALQGDVRVGYSTQDLSAHAGKRYQCTSGVLHLVDGQSHANIAVPIIQEDIWAPTLEFKMTLSDPEACLLGIYLKTCRVKVLHRGPQVHREP